MRWYHGLLALGAGAAVGATIGALAKTDGPTGQPDARWGAVAGASAGLLLVGVAGVGALFADSTRSAGLTAALPVGALVAVTAASQAVK